MRAEHLVRLYNSTSTPPHIPKTLLLYEDGPKTSSPQHPHPVFSHCANQLSMGARTIVHIMVQTGYIMDYGVYYAE